jgi:hypothetical protein
LVDKFCHVSALTYSVENVCFLLGIFYDNVVYLCVVLYGCEIWSLKLREECRLEGARGQSAEENIWTEEGSSDGRLEKTA